MKWLAPHMREAAKTTTDKKLAQRLVAWSKIIDAHAENELPSWLTDDQIRIAICAGIDLALGADRAEIERLAYIRSGETGALPVIRPAAANRSMPDGRKYADIGIAQLNLVHWADRFKTGDRAKAAATVATWLLAPIANATEALRLLRTSRVNWNSETKARATPEKARIVNSILTAYDQLQPPAELPTFDLAPE